MARRDAHSGAVRFLTVFVWRFFDYCSADLVYCSADFGLLCRTARRSSPRARWV